MIIQILSLFLIFLTEAEAYFCIKTMIEISHSFLNAKTNSEDLREMRWYFTFDGESFTNMCESFFQIVKVYIESTTQLILSLLIIRLKIKNSRK